MRKANMSFRIVQFYNGWESRMFTELVDNVCWFEKMLREKVVNAVMVTTNSLDKRLCKTLETDADDINVTQGAYTYTWKLSSSSLPSYFYGETFRDMFQVDGRPKLTCHIHLNSVQTSKVNSNCASQIASTLLVVQDKFNATYFAKGTLQ